MLFIIDFRERGNSVAKTKKTAGSDTEVSMERRAAKERRGVGERRKTDVRVGEEKRTSQRRAVTRRRQIDPTTCERDYTGDEIEFMQAMDAYKRSSGRMFPTCSEVLEVIRSLGYEKRTTEPPLSEGAEQPTEESLETLTADTDSARDADTDPGRDTMAVE
jgi:hypothetical protein